MKNMAMKLLALVVALGLSAAMLPEPVEAKKQSKRGRVIASGVRLRLYRLGAPNKVRVISFSRSATPTLDTMLATNELPGRERVSSMARRRGAIAAINGDYSRPSGRPVFTFARDGRLDQTGAIDPATGGYLRGRNFAIDIYKKRTFFSKPKTRAWIWIPSQDGGKSREVHRVNDQSFKGQASKQIRAFTAVGGKEARPPHGGCYVRLRAAGRRKAVEPTHAPVDGDGVPLATAGVEQRHFVQKRTCRYKRVPPKDGITLYSPRKGKRAKILRSMTVGTTAKYGWSFGWPKVFDSVGGNPTLIEDGVVQKHSIYTGTSFAGGRHPRTAVAYNSKNHKLFLVTVDGRQPGYSVGMTLAGLTHFLRSRLGATDALNLDGGGSTTMVVKGKVKGRPSDGSERPVSSALVLLPGADPGEPSQPAAPLLELAPSPEIPTPSPQIPTPDGSPYDLMTEDPASVGGMSAWLEDQGHELPGFLQRAADNFEASRQPATE
ncbi:MAG: phosphodiester glycosidase family protein [Actinomycetota bacterium]